jgi:hypothetical protein
VIDKNTSTLGLLLGTRTAAPSIVVNAASLVAAPRGADAALRAPVAGLALHAAQHEASNTAAAMTRTPEARRTW